MNNKGFGLSELLVFIGIFLFALVAITIYGSVKLGNDSYYDEPDVKIQDDSEDLEPTKIEVKEEYINLENKLEDAAKKYSFDTSKNIVITLSDLQDAKLIGDLIDPNDKSILCDGYVVYNNVDNQFKPYINCNGMYTTESYDNKNLN